MSNMFFESWQSLIRTSGSTVLAYLTLIAMLRVSGKRTLAKMNAFDFIVTVALGSTFATIALSKDVALADGALIFLLMILMQFIITWLSVRMKFVKNLVASQPVLLLFKGEVLHKVMKRERILLEDLYVTVRQKNIADLKNVDAIVLETTGDLTVISGLPMAGVQTFTDIENYPVHGAAGT